MAWIRRFFSWLFKDIEVEAIDPITTPLEAPVRPSEPPAVPKPEEVAPPVITKPTEPIMTNREKLYEVAFNSLGKDMRADKSVPKELGCATSLSKVLSTAGVKGLPTTGIASTAVLYQWLKINSQFTPVKTPDVGDIVIYPTGYDDQNIPGLPKIANGHAFIKGKYQMLSNNSDTGKWSNHWESLAKADAYYTQYGGIPRYCFRFK